MNDTIIQRRRYELNCRHCNELFMGFLNQRFCCAEHRVDFFNKLQKGEKFVVKCLYCSKNFKQRTHSQKLCSQSCVQKYRKYKTDVIVSKICKLCNLEKPLNDFPKYKRTYWNACKSCSLANRRDYYENDDNEKLKNQVKRFRERRSLELYMLMKNYLKDKKCLYCLESDALVLQFDHRNPDNKIANISDMVNKAVSKGVFLSEIDKCDILCANCHIRRTAKQQRWFEKYEKLVEYV